MHALIDSLTSLMSHNTDLPRVFPYVHEGQTVWVKQGEKDCVSAFQRWQFRRRGHNKRNRSPACMALLIEARAMRRLKRYGIHAPTLLAFRPHFIVLSHTGEGVHGVLHASPPPTLASMLAQGMGALLGRMHLFRISHGNAKLRNFTYDGQHVNCIDFENMQSALPFFLQRMKDLIMLCGSMTSYPTRGLIPNLLAAYEGHHSLRSFYGFIILLLPLFVLLYPLRNLLGRDIRETCNALHGCYAFMLRGK